MTRETLEKLPQEVRNRIERFKKDSKNNIRYRELYVNKGIGYVEGLRDAGLISENECKALKCYVTI